MQEKLKKIKKRKVAAKGYFLLNYFILYIKINNKYYIDNHD
jgi:hypothetical protein